MDNTGRFRQLPEQKKNVLSALIDSIEIVKAIVNKDEHFLTTELPKNEYGDDFDSTTLIYQNIFPRKRRMDFKDTREVYITVSFSGFSRRSNAISNKNVTFFIYCHYELLKFDNDGDRLDFITNKIVELFEEKEVGGLGEMQLIGNEEFEIDDGTYIGVWLKFKFLDWN